MFTPNSNVRLLNVPLEGDYQNTLFFSSISEQTGYFLSHTVRAVDNFSYVFKDAYLRVSGSAEQLYKCNYVMYRNANFSDKWFYAFIDRIERASENSANIYIRTDVIQTWLFDVTVYQCLIERQHSTTDRPGDNVVAEPIGSGRSTYTPVVKNNLNDRMKVGVFITSVGENPAGGVVINGVFTGAILGAVASIKNDEEIQTVRDFLNRFVEGGQAEAIPKIQMFIGTDGVEQGSISRYPTTINGYTPRNKKLLTGSFISVYVNVAGQEAEFNPDNCKTRTPGGTLVYRQVGDPLSGTYYVYFPEYGHNDAYPTSNSSLMGVSVTMPEGTWAYNYYRNNYQLHSASNAVLINSMKFDRMAAGYDAFGKAAGGLGNTVEGGIIATASGGTMGWSKIGSGIGDTFSGGVSYAKYLSGNDEYTAKLMAIDESLKGPAVGGVATPNPYVAANNLVLEIGYKAAPKRVLELYDSYLDKYGYAQNKVATPKFMTRANWTYTKTADFAMSGALPAEDAAVFKQVFNNGVTFWNPSARFGDYSQSNPVR